MLKGMLQGVFGTRHERERKRVQPIVDAINEEYERLHSVSEEELRGQTERSDHLCDRRAGVNDRIARSDRAAGVSRSRSGSSLDAAGLIAC